MYIPADKTHNFYKMDAADHKALIRKNAEKEYKKSDNNRLDEINKADKKIATKLELEDRIHSIVLCEACVNLKDHKENFENCIACRLINPTKSNIGKISQQILQHAINVIRSKTKMNQWKNTCSTVTWFENLPNKKNLHFIQFDIVNFYPSISENLLMQALQWAKNFTKFTDEEIEIILTCKKSLLIHSGETWQKKGDIDFDVTMGSYDGAEVCEIVGLFLLSLLENLQQKENLKKILNLQSVENVFVSSGIYRDDALMAVNLTNRQAENLKKEICKIFKDLGLQITIEPNKKVVNFLDVTFDLQRNIYKPYMKPNDTPLYIHAKSNHPPSILKNVPKSVEIRLSSISSDANIFNEAKKPYEKALRESGHNCDLKFQEKSDMNQHKKKQRKRKVIYFNPPFSKNVSTNIGSVFLKIVDKCFPQNHKLHKILNRRTLKVSYSCVQNLKSVINAHNVKLRKEHETNLQHTQNLQQNQNLQQSQNLQQIVNLQQSQNLQQTQNLQQNQNLQQIQNLQQNQNLQHIEEQCKFCKETPCIVEIGCDNENVIYQATVTQENGKVETYVGLSAPKFYKRYQSHKTNFRYEKYSHATTLSTHIWDLKNQNINFRLNWKIIDRGKPYCSNSRVCFLCLKEKYHIIFKPEESTLNKRNELGSRCPHKQHSLLRRIK